LFFNQYIPVKGKRSTNEVSEENAARKNVAPQASRKLFGSFLPDKRPQSTGPSKVLDELTTYLNESIIEQEDQNWSPLQYWKRNADRFKNLSEIALHLFCIPASSANIERVFSVAKDILSAKRNRMKSDLFRKILFIRRNYFLLNA
jgi:hypothetical protein